VEENEVKPLTPTEVPLATFDMGFYGPQGPVARLNQCLNHMWSATEQYEGREIEFRHFTDHRNIPAAIVEALCDVFRAVGWKVTAGPASELHTPGEPFLLFERGIDPQPEPEPEE
jgi:hypothetical protein